MDPNATQLEYPIVFGGALKALPNKRFGGLLVPFGSPQTKDSDGEYFHPRTDFYTLEGPRPVIFHHGFSPHFKKTLLGLGTLKAVPEGIAIEADFTNLPDATFREIMQDAQKGRLSWSSGAANHMVERGKDGAINKWHIAEASITYRPKNPSARLVPLKALEWSDDDDNDKRSIMEALFTSFMKHVLNRKDDELIDAMKSSAADAEDVDLDADALLVRARLNAIGVSNRG